MKDENINLVIGKKVEQKIGKAINIPTLIIFGSVFLVAFSLLVYSLILSARSAALVDEAGKIRTQITSSESKKERILVVGERLGAIRNILSARSSADIVAEKVLKIIPAEFTVDILEADNKQVSVSLTSSDLSEFASFLEDTLPRFAAKNTVGVTSVVINSFAQGKGDYNLNLMFGLKKSL